jgi:hypothetical protein
LNLRPERAAIHFRPPAQFISSSDAVRYSIPV